MVNYEKHTVSLLGQNWDLYTPLQKAENGAIPQSKGFAYIERIGSEVIQRYYVTTYRPTMQGTVQVSIQKDVETIDPPKQLVNGEALPVFTVREALTTQLFNLPSGANPRGENDGKFLIRALCEVAMPSISHDIIPYDFDQQSADFNPIQPLIFELESTEDSITVVLKDAENSENVQVKLNESEFQSGLTFENLSSGIYTVSVKERESIILNQEIEI